jgi:hypothetical protein
MLAINPPTAALLLSEYVDLQPGEWVVRNAANSGVGRWVIAFAKTRGLKTVNIVRRPELVAELEAIGGDVVVVDSPVVPNRIKAAVGQAELRLALDGVSGPATGVLAATLFIPQRRSPQNSSVARYFPPVRIEGPNRKARRPATPARPTSRREPHLANHPQTVSPDVHAGCSEGPPGGRGLAHSDQVMLLWL